ncbi:MAG: hypothetical protein ABUK01_08320 [Leptospirales bacterium]
MKRIFLNGLLLLAVIVGFSISAKTPTKSKEKVKVKISWKYKNVPESMKVYYTSSDDIKEHPLWKTKSVSDRSAIPVGKEISNGKFMVERGGAFRFVLVYHNTTGEEIYFFAAPHRVEPEENSLGFKFKCLCVNHAFHVPAGEYWYRIVEFRASEHITGNKLDISHTIVKVSDDELEYYSNSGNTHGM